MTITFLVRTDKKSNKQNETDVFSFATTVNWNFEKCRQLLHHEPIALLI